LQALAFAARGLPGAKVGNVHAVWLSHFALSFDKIMQITASVSGALAHPPGFLWPRADGMLLGMWSTALGLRDGRKMVVD
jgi:hypothetical protein